MPLRERKIGRRRGRGGRRPWPSALVTGVLALVLGGAASWVAAAGVIHEVVQRGRAFAVKSITIAAGDTVRFGNEDSFIHQIFIDSPSLAFDSPEQLPGQFIDVTFPRKGEYTVLCHIHPLMRLTVTVQ